MSNELVKQNRQIETKLPNYHSMRGIDHSIASFLILKRKTGLLVFTQRCLFEEWQHANSSFLTDNFCFWSPQLHAWRFEATVIRVVICERRSELEQHKRGIKFDATWIKGEWQPEQKALPEPCKLITDGEYL